jgi:hypothetical protein
MPLSVRRSRFAVRRSSFTVSGSRAPRSGLDDRLEAYPTLVSGASSVYSRTRGSLLAELERLGTSRDVKKSNVG